LQKRLRHAAARDNRFRLSHGGKRRNDRRFLAVRRRFQFFAHLPRTHLDGAALQLADSTPVIGLTLRYDRLDNFWFCLLHKLAHIGRHMDDKRNEAFIDDLSLRDVEGVRRDPKEDEADAWAEQALIPEDVWQTSRVKNQPSPLAVMELAQRLSIHPAIVAGRVRHETRNFRLLSHFVGTGEVRRHFTKAQHYA